MKFKIIGPLVPSLLFGCFAVLNLHCETTCRRVFDPRFPGLEECKSHIRIETEYARAPTPQKRSLWCWAASLSMIYSELGLFHQTRKYCVTKFWDFGQHDQRTFLCNFSPNESELH
jgi:hypothetical protein